jgi:hypothetical protein
VTTRSRIIAEYERSLKQYPNIKVGEDFQGYKTELRTAETHDRRRRT